MLGATSDPLGKAMVLRADSVHRVMERRTFLGVIAGGLLAAPLAAAAHPVNGGTASARDFASWDTRKTEPSSSSGDGRRGRPSAPANWPPSSSDFSPTCS